MSWRREYVPPRVFKVFMYSGMLAWLYRRTPFTTRLFIPECRVLYAPQLFGAVLVLQGELLITGRTFLKVVRNAGMVLQGEPHLTTRLFIPNEGCFDAPQLFEAAQVLQGEPTFTNRNHPRDIQILMHRSSFWLLGSARRTPLHHR
jgi:hypothetical protein